MNSIKFIFLVFVLSYLFSCSERCPSVRDFNVGEILLISAESKSYSYCDLLENSVEKDHDAILKISLLEFDGSVGYDHGYVLVKLIDTIGENEYIKATQNISNKEKGLIKDYLDAGLEYGNIKKFQKQSLEKVFPCVYNFLSK